MLKISPLLLAIGHKAHGAHCFSLTMINASDVFLGFLIGPFAGYLKSHINKAKNSSNASNRRAKIVKTKSRWFMFAGISLCSFVLKTTFFIGNDGDWVEPLAQRLTESAARGNEPLQIGQTHASSLGNWTKSKKIGIVATAFLGTEIKGSDENFLSEPYIQSFCNAKGWTKPLFIYWWVQSLRAGIIVWYAKPAANWASAVRISSNNSIFSCKLIFVLSKQSRNDSYAFTRAE